MQIIDIIFGADEHLRYGQPFLSEMFCHVEEGAVLLHRLSADADKCRVSDEAEVTAVGAGGGEFVNLFRFVSGMCDVEFLKFFGYHGGMFYFCS